jgi:hypothetical protein
MARFQTLPEPENNTEEVKENEDQDEEEEMDVVTAIDPSTHLSNQDFDEIRS